MSPARIKSGRVVLFGATGYTGELVAQAMVDRGLAPVLAGRSAERLATMAAAIGGLPTAVADVTDPASVSALLSPGDVLVTTVGPFLRWGQPALDAAVQAGAVYLDSTGEPAFIRRVFDEVGPVAAASGAGLLTAMGYDYVPGNLAGALAIKDAHGRAVRVDVGYVTTALAKTGMLSAVSGGTAGSALGVALEPGFAFRGGRIVNARAAARVRSLPLPSGGRRSMVSLAGSEHFTLPRLSPTLREVNVYTDWAGPLARPAQAASALGGMAIRIPGAAAASRALVDRIPIRRGGPGEDARRTVLSGATAIAYDEEGHPLATVHLVGPNGYDFTARILAWGAERALTEGLRGVGALGPVDGFGLEDLEAGCAEAGLVRA